jgi:small basic protein
MQINGKTLLIAIVIGLIVSIIVGVLFYLALPDWPNTEMLSIVISAIIFFNTVFWSYQGIESYKKKK